jgi:formylglycine-generating enzyme required for sulfatase activity
MKTKFILSFLIGVASLCQSAWAAPQILNYSGKISVSGQPYTGQAHFKFALLNRTGTVSYWTNDGNYTLVQEPPGAVAVTLTDGVYSVALGNASLTNMQAIPGQIFQDHNDAHLRIWFAQSANGPFDLLTPDQAIGSVPYALNGNLAAGNSSSGNVSNSSGSQSGPASVVSMAGGFVRLIANGPNNPSGTLVLLAGDTAEVVAYVGETTGLLEYSFGEHGFVLPKTFDSFRQTLIGPGSVRLTAPTGGKAFANLRVHRANGRDNLNLAGGATSGSQAPAIVSIPNQQTVVLGGKTSLIVSASGDNLTYQWKKNGQNIPGATSSALTFAESRLEDNGTYQVEITGANGNVTTQNVDLLVNNDLCRVPGGSYPSINGGNATLNEFLIDKYETRYSEWIRIMKWANDHNYSFSSPGSNSIYVNGTEGTDQHPVHSIQWYDAMKWANARSEKEGLTPCYYTDSSKQTVYRQGNVYVQLSFTNFAANGYRLPNRDEFVAAARGGLVGKKYPWGNTIDLAYTNINQSNRFTEKAGALHYTILPVGRLLPNGYGIHDIYGNLAEMTGDTRSPSYPEHHYYAEVSYKSGGGIQLGSFTYKHHGTQTGSAVSAVGFRLVRRP